MVWSSFWVGIAWGLSILGLAPAYIGVICLIVLGQGHERRVLHSARRTFPLAALSRCFAGRELELALRVGAQATLQ